MKEGKKMAIKDPKCLGNSAQDAADHCQLPVGCGVTVPVPGAAPFGIRQPKVLQKVKPSYRHWDYSSAANPVQASL